MLKRLERSPLSGRGELRSGKTPYDLLAVNLKITQGTGRRRGRAHRGAGGAARARRLGLDPGARSRSQGHRQPDGEHGADAPPAFELPFVVQGPWDDPLIWPDPQSLIKRSGAAAPLLDAVRNRLKRDAAKAAAGGQGRRPRRAPPPVIHAGAAITAR